MIAAASKFWDRMVSGPFSPTRQASQLVAVLAVLALAWPAALVHGQRPPMHYFHAADLPPGTVGQGQLLRGGPLPGYFQPVEISAPPGVRISLAEDGNFGLPQAAPLKVGMLLGHVYRLRVTGIPLHEGFEVYPSIEVINRLYPPEGKKLRFPIPIELTQEELQFALDGRFVVRVIYLEDPDTALPFREQAHQRYYEAGPGEDPLRTADQLGRPMAILRMGSRVPAAMGAGRGFLFTTPPLMRYPAIEAAPAAGGNGHPDAGRSRGASDVSWRGLEDGLRGQKFPRLPARYGSVPDSPPEGNLNR